MSVVSIGNKTCTDICKRYKAKRPHKGSRYSSGQIRCNICAIFMTSEAATPDGRCVCCNYKVRTMPRASKFKGMYHEKTGTGNTIDG